MGGGKEMKYLKWTNSIAVFDPEWATANSDCFPKMGDVISKTGQDVWQVVLVVVLKTRQIPSKMKMSYFQNYLPQAKRKRFPESRNKLLVCPMASGGTRV